MMMAGKRTNDQKSINQSNMLMLLMLLFISISNFDFDFFLANYPGNQNLHSPMMIIINQQIFFSAGESNSIINDDVDV